MAAHLHTAAATMHRSLSLLLLMCCGGPQPQVCSNSEFHPNDWMCLSRDGGPSNGLLVTFAIGESWSPKVFDLKCTTELSSGVARFKLTGNYCHNITPWNLSSEDPVFFSTVCDIPELGDWQIDKSQFTSPYGGTYVTRTNEGTFCP